MVEKEDSQMMMQNKPVQYFNADYIEQCEKMSHKEIIEMLYKQIQFYQTIHSAKNDKSVLISLKINGAMLDKFKQQCEMKKLKYQTQIKNLMNQWLLETLK